MQVLDPEFANKQYEDAMAERRKIADREDTQAYGTGERVGAQEYGTSERVAGEQTARDVAAQADVVGDENAQRDADIALKKQRTDSALATKKGELMNAVASKVMTEEEAAAEYELYQKKLEGEAAAAGPDTHTAVPPDVAAARGGDIAKHPDRYDYNAKTQEIKPIDPARTPQEIKTAGDFSTGLIETRSTLQNLDKALELAPQVFEGSGVFGVGGAQQRAQAVLKTPDAYDPETVAQAKATQAYFNIMGKEAITAMSVTLSGATTEYEMKRFLEIMANETTPLETKKLELGRMREKVAAYEKLQAQQVEESGGDPSAGSTLVNPPPAETAPAGDPLAEARKAIAAGANRDAVIKRLQENGIDPTGL
jgi:hypothetical protein